ncbi:MAG: 3-methyl-2-oxobutanoate hydroxymethyltransferase [Acidobacteria bacterium]|nr:3-methyl-2-oxobutanoate hydroxymethyltransferase [Acidobacteriota bacterium]
MSHAPSDQASGATPSLRAHVTLPQIQRWKDEGRPLAMLTAYDAPTALVADAAGVDILLVGDSVGNVCLGFETTLPVTMAMMNHHVEAVARTKPKALLVADMPYLSFHLSVEDTLRNAGGFLQRGAQAVKLEGGAKRLAMIHALVDAEIPVMGHLGLTPQSVNAMGGYKVQGRAEAEALAILDDAVSLQEAGCFALVLEGIPADLATRITETLHIPTLGIGAGLHCSGQVLVFHDLLGLLPQRPAKFVRKYLEGFDLMKDATERWIADVRSGAFPGLAESYKLPEEIRPAVASWQPGRRR